MMLPEAILLNIFSFAPSFVFYHHCRTILKYDTATTISLVSKYYFQYIDNKDQIHNLIILDYFINHRHLLILDNKHHFENYLKESRWANNICKKNPKDESIKNSLRNIMRLSYFVNCLRDLERHQRSISKDKIEQTNIGVSYRYLIESINSESESQVKMLKYYINHMSAFII